MERAGRLRRWLAGALSAHLRWWALAAYALAALVLTDPLGRRLHRVLPADAIDPALNTWIVWWNAQAVPLTPAWWNAPIFHPSPGSLALSEHLLGLYPLTSPLQWLGASPVAAYNAALLLSFPLCALGACALCHELTGRRDAAFLGGLAFGFAPLRIAHLGHIQVLSAYGMPLALLGLHRFVRTRRKRDLALFAGAWLLQALCNGYYLFFFSVLVALWLAWFLRGAAARPALRPILVAWALAAASLAPLLLLYRSTHASLGLQRSADEVRTFSADLASFLSASRALAWGGLSLENPGGAELFPGNTVLALLAATVLAAPLSAGVRRSRPRRWRWLALGAAAVLTAVAASPLLFGPWRLTLAEQRLLSVTSPHKPLGLALLALAAFAVGSEPMVRAWRRRSPLVFYLLAAVAMALLCLGPIAHAFGEPVWHGAPYSWLMRLPGFASLRAPSRFAMPGVLALAAAASLAFVRLGGAGRPARVLALVVGCGFLADGWVREMPLAPVPARSVLVEQDGERHVPVLELPMRGPFAPHPAALALDTAAMFRSMDHRHPVVNGYSGHFPPHYHPLRSGLLDFEPGVLEALASLGPLDVRVDDRAEAGAAWRRVLSSWPGARRLGSNESESLYRLPAAHRAPFDCAATVPIRFVSATPREDYARLAHDGDWTTRWHSFPQDGRESVTIDLGEPRVVVGLRIGLGRHPADYPRELIVETRLAGAAWSEAWRGRTAGEAVRAALAQPTRAVLDIAFPPRRLRDLRLRQIGTAPLFYFSIVELAVCGSAASPPATARARGREAVVGAGLL